jgi:hypothetical protein
VTRVDQHSPCHTAKLRRARTGPRVSNDPRGKQRYLCETGCTPEFSRRTARHNQVPRPERI